MYLNKLKLDQCYNIWSTYDQKMLINLTKNLKFGPHSKKLKLIHMQPKKIKFGPHSSKKLKFGPHSITKNKILSTFDKK